MATAITSTTEKDSRLAGQELGATIRDAFDGEPADAVVLFASARHDYGRLLEALAEESGTEVIAGASSAGEFTDRTRAEGAASALALRASNMRFSVGIGPDLSRDPAAAARRVTKDFQGSTAHGLPYRSALVMTDALSGNAETLVEELTVATGGNYRFFGGGAGDDARFQRTHVFAGTQAMTDAVAALEILSMEPPGIGVAHGWQPASQPFRVTETEGMRLVSLNGTPAVDVIADHAEATGQTLDRDAPLPFFLHNVLGIKSSGGAYRLRVPLSINDDGSVSCAAVIPTGTILHIMKTSETSAALAAERATRAALAGLNGRPPGAGMVFDCVATRLRLGQAFDSELQVCADLLRPAGFVGCNTYGQIARAEGQFSGFHNCTAVVFVLPE